MDKESPPRAWVEVDAEAIAHNLAVARRASGGALQLPIVKANAYGHGLEQVARRLDAEGVAFFGVANAGEARRLQQAGVAAPPFIVGPTLPGEREEIVSCGWGCTVSTWEEALHFQEIAALLDKEFAVHVAVDTGMGREGFMPRQLGQLIPQLKELSHLRIEGAMSHFCAADEDAAITRQQICLFNEGVRELEQHFALKYKHIAASAGLMCYEVAAANMVRPGIILYGVAPMESPLGAELRPTLCLYARVLLVRELPAGHGVSYGSTYTTAAPSRVATVGIGYEDGWPRHLSGSGAQVYIGGQACPMLGRVTMDMIMADVSHLPTVQPGDEVELIGPHQSVEQVAAWAGTIPWEVFTGLGMRMPRLYGAARPLHSGLVG